MTSFSITHFFSFQFKKMKNFFSDEDYHNLKSHIHDNQKFQKVISDYLPSPNQAMLSHLFVDCLVLEQKENALFILETFLPTSKQSEWFKGLIGVISSGLFSMVEWVISQITGGISQYDFDAYCLFLSVSQQRDLRIIDLLCQHVGDNEIKKECLIYVMRRIFLEEGDKKLEFLRKGYCLFQHCPGKYEDNEGFSLLETFIHLQNRIQLRAANKIYFWIFPKIYRNQKFLLEQANRSFDKFYKEF